MFFVLAVLFAGFLFFEGCTNNPPMKNAIITNISFKIESGTNPVLGNKSAPITIIEFTDYQCPYCKKHAIETFPQIETNYIKIGKVKYYLRDFPLEMHTNAKNAALASKCVEQNKYWEMHTLLFTKQKEWAIYSETQLASKFTEYASDLGIDKRTFSSCYSDNKFKQQIFSDIDAGQLYGITGVPSTIILFPKSANETKFLEFFSIYSEYVNKGYLSISRDSEGNYAFFVKGAFPYKIFKQILDL